MALFGRDLRRMSSIMSSSSGNNPVPPESEENDGKCTGEKVKSCMKMFFAQLFSHVGLCALVLGYSIVGAFIFGYLEKDNELQTRVKVGDARKHTLDELYNITADLRLELILQEEEIVSLLSEIRRLQKESKTCDRVLRRQKGFLRTVISRYKGDNVPLTDSRCRELCESENIKKRTCQDLCVKAKSCTLLRKISVKESNDTSDRNERSVREEVIVSLNEDFRLREEKYDDESFECKRFKCVTEDLEHRTLCLRFRSTEFKNNRVRLENNENDDKHFNVLWRENWTQEAGKVLKQFEQDVIRKAKSEGYDGQDKNDTATLQWNFSGALLYSVTVITTIGYGNIAPKTKWGRIVTMIYAIFGMPLFLMWASQMGTFLAQSFQFLYANICCVLCLRSQKRRAAANKNSRNAKFLDGSSQISLDKPVRVEIIEPMSADDFRRQREGSIYDNLVEEEESEDGKIRLLPTVVSVSASNSSPVTSILPTPQYLFPHNSLSPNAQNGRKPSSNDGDVSKAASSTQDGPSIAPQPSSGRVPVFLVLAFVSGYITLGATIFSTWEKWTLLEGAYFSFITLTTIGFGDFVPGDAVLNDDSEHGQAKLILACIYLLLGLAVISMAINLVQEEIIEKFRQLAINIGIIESPREEEDPSR